MTALREPETSQSDKSLLEHFSKEMWQSIARFLTTSDLTNLAKTCQAFRVTLPKTPQYIGEKERALFLQNTGRQYQLLCGDSDALHAIFAQLQRAAASDPIQCLTEQYEAIQHWQNGDYTIDCATADVDNLKARAKKGFNLTPLLAMLKLEIIKTKPADSEYFLNIRHEDSHFDYQRDYQRIQWFYGLAMACTMVAGSCLIAPYLITSVAGSAVIMPLLITASVGALIFFTLASQLGYTHQRALHGFVLNDDFLEKDKESSVVSSAATKRF